MSMFKYSCSAAMQNELQYWNKDQCGTEPVCDPIHFYSITIPMWINVLALSIICIGVHFFAYLSLARIAKKYRIT